MKTIDRHVLPDHLRAGLDAVFVGTAAGPTSAARGHYYAGPGNEFWWLLFEAGLTPIRLSPSEDHRVVEFGLGLTDLAKHVSAASDRGLGGQYDVQDLVAKIERDRPSWLVFHGKEAAKAASRALGHGGYVRLGEQSWAIGGSRVFVVPSASGSNRDSTRLEGKSSRVDWYRELASLLGR